MQCIFRILLPAAVTANMADQMMLVALPLMAVLLLGATPAEVGVLVAAHAAAWLAISLPAGVLVDRFDRRTLLVGSQLFAALAYAMSWLAADLGSLAALLGAAFIGAGGIVLFVLSTTAFLPALTQHSGLPAANARLELARGVATIAAPAAVALLAERDDIALAGLMASAFALLAAILLSRLPRANPPLQVRPPLLAALRAGAVFVLGQKLLRPIALCAIFWNFAFFVLTASFVPFALGPVGLAPAQAALAQAAYGGGALLAGAIGGWAIGRQSPNLVLLFGPGVSMLAGCLILLAPVAGAAPAPGTAIASATLCAGCGWFLIGFGPVLWLICQTTVRQLVTPPDLIGRASATIQTAIYGVRPLGALCGGAVAATAGPGAAIAMATLAFALSFVISAASPLGRLTALPQPAQ